MQDHYALAAARLRRALDAQEDTELAAEAAATDLANAHLAQEEALANAATAESYSAAARADDRIARLEVDAAARIYTDLGGPGWGSETGSEVWDERVAADRAEATLAAQDEAEYRGIYTPEQRAAAAAEEASLSPRAQAEAASAPGWGPNAAAK